MTSDAALDGTARQLPTRKVEKVWGRDTLPEPFVAPDAARIGEILFEPPPEMPELLVKYLFTSEKLSVQVHPSDATAQPGEAGKDECWLILDAEPGAKLAIGFDERISPARIEAAARDGSIEDLLTWHDVAPGEIYYLPAGTVHAIGPGLALVEVQQNSDTTFRLYDYGRDRDLHLERGLAVAQGTPYAARHKGTVAQREPCLVDGPYFRLDRIVGEPSAADRDAYSQGALVLPLEGEVTLRGAAGAVKAGECAYAPSLDAIDLRHAGVTLLTRTA
ncbi:MAG: class I mannose-6-phosphate isomerase [Erythrobacter sp.]|uniref:class I mannose-6-phosphate isomerase n=1 Tax=Erythrobacter sp. TaxID=1042 RepID=UPI00261E824C|nr:class I mannose-6-phosphate isomerase [Erythrobacter sp.]MDJ0979051.1 class I mannose-6-phosphate isomerase [Erythrobacter sp.]